MAAGPIRGSFRQAPNPAKPTNLSETAPNGKNVYKRELRRSSSLSKDIFKPYSRPVNLYAFKAGAGSSKGIMEKLTKAIRGVFSFIYQSVGDQDDQDNAAAQDPSSAAVATRPEDVSTQYVAADSEENNVKTVEKEEQADGRPPKIELSNDPTEILSDLILNPVYRQSKNEAFKQIGRFFQSKGLSKLTQYEYDQMSAILRRLTSSSPTTYQPTHQPPLFSYEPPIPTNPSLLTAPSLADFCDTDQFIDRRRDGVKPSRVFSARYEYEDEEFLKTAKGKGKEGSDDDGESLVSSMHQSRNVVYVPVPCEPQLNLERAPRPVKLPLDTNTIISSSRAARREPEPFESGAVQAPLTQKSALPPEPVTVATRDPPKLFEAPNIEPVDESSLKAKIPRSTKFDFGPATIPSSSEVAIRPVPEFKIVTEGEGKDNEDKPKDAAPQKQAADTAKPFTFNLPAAQTSSKADAGKETKPLFTFGSGSLGDQKPAEQNSATTWSQQALPIDHKPFTFGSSLNQQTGPRPFAFGQNPDQKTEPSAPTPFVFKTASEQPTQPPESKPFTLSGFSSQKQPQEPKQLTFGAPEAKPTEPDLASKSAEPSKLSPSLTSTDQQKPFSFNQNTSLKPSGFTFGLASTTPVPSGPFTFGSAPPTAAGEKSLPPRAVTLSGFEEAANSAAPGNSPVLSHPGTGDATSTSANNISTSTKPFAFGAKPTDTAAIDDSGPSAIHRSDNPPVFTFGQHQQFSQPKDTAKRTSEFMFSQPQSQAQSQPPLMFGQSQQQQQSQLSSSTVGHSQQPSVFGQSQPAFAFGQPQTSATASSPFGASFNPQPPTAPFALAAPNSQSPATQPQSQFAFSQTQPSFSFGGGSQAAPFVFGQQPDISNPQMAFNVGSSPASTGSGPRQRLTPVSRRRKR